jgi:hypothetical protein
MNSTIANRKQKMVDTFAQRGAPPALVAKAILDAVRTNPAVRPVGTDARVLAALTRMAPQLTTKLGGMLSRRFGAAG